MRVASWPSMGRLCRERHSTSKLKLSELPVVKGRAHEHQLRQQPAIPHPQSRPLRQVQSEMRRYFFACGGEADKQWARHYCQQPLPTLI
mmetsp:Transcript_94510/g.166880  ORF Transcript_94510/g.166880 Transcript_94510/m.166880 type:complete len:89 (+) Transcript_94510:333-599(+)